MTCPPFLLVLSEATTQFHFMCLQGIGPNDLTSLKKSLCHINSFCTVSVYSNKGIVLQRFFNYTDGDVIMLTVMLLNCLTLSWFD